MNWLKRIVVFMLVAGILGTIFTTGQLQGVFGQLFVLIAVFLLVVEIFPQFIVAEEKKTPPQNPEQKEKAAEGN
jgi:hypothetical protein